MHSLLGRSRSCPSKAVAAFLSRRVYVQAVESGWQLLLELKLLRLLLCCLLWPWFVLALGWARTGCWTFVGFGTLPDCKTLNCGSKTSACANTAPSNGPTFGKTLPPPLLHSNARSVHGRALHLVGRLEVAEDLLCDVLVSLEPVGVEVHMLT